MPGAGRRRFLLTPTAPSPLRDPRPPGTADPHPTPPAGATTHSERGARAPGRPPRRRPRAHGPGTPAPGAAPRSRGLPDPARAWGKALLPLPPGTGHRHPAAGTAPAPAPGTRLLALPRHRAPGPDPAPRLRPRSPSEPCAPVPAPLPAPGTALRHWDPSSPGPNAALLVPGPPPSPVTGSGDRAPPLSWRRPRSRHLFSYRCPWHRGHPLS